MLFLFFIFLLLQQNLAYLTKIGIIVNLDELIIILLLLMLLLKKIILKRNFCKSKIALALFLLIIFGLVSTFMHRLVPFPIALGGLLLFLKGFILFYIFLNSDLNQFELNKFRKMFYIVGIITLCYAVLGVIWPHFFLESIGVTYQARFGIPALQSFLGHPGAFAALMGICFCFSFAEALIRKKSIYILMSVIFLISIIFSMRRTTLLGVLIAFFSVLLLKEVRKKIAFRIVFTHINIILVVLTLFSGIIFVSYENLVVSYIKHESPRLFLLKAGIKIAKDYFPLGAGFGTFSGGINQKFYSPLFYKYRLNYISGLSESTRNFINDTFWPHILAETGVLGFICYVWIIVIFFLICLKAIKYFFDQDKLIFSIASTMILILGLVESTKATFFEISLWAFFYFGSIAILQSWLCNNKKNNENSPDS